jgi:mRNA-degrading endonuclease RelE of RelBE toxin-antitoxin system
VKAAVLTTSRYERDARRLLTEAEKTALQEAISENPEAHPVAPGTGGLRKARWGRQGKGKRGGVRLIYYYWTADNEVYLLFLYAKNEHEDMDAAGRHVAIRFVEDLKRDKEKKRRQARP